jgi:hypothetical protein
MNTLDLRMPVPLMFHIHVSRVEELQQAWGRPIHLWPSRALLTSLIKSLRGPHGILRLGFGAAPVIRSGSRQGTERLAAMTAGSSRLALLGR